MAIENKTVEELAEVLRKEKPGISEMSAAIWAGVLKRYACCDKARFMHCVCMYAFKCPDHGETHIGTHD